MNWIESLYALDPHLDHEQDDEEEDEGSVEVGDVEGGAKPTDKSVTADHHGKKHCCQFWAEISHKTEKEKQLLNMSVSEASRGLICIPLAN